MLETPLGVDASRAGKPGYIATVNGLGYHLCIRQFPAASAASANTSTREPPADSRAILRH